MAVTAEFLPVLFESGEEAGYIKVEIMGTRCITSSEYCSFDPRAEPRC